MNRLIGVFTAAALTLACGLAGAPVAAAADYGPLSHAGLRRVSAAPAGLRLNLQLGLSYDARGVQNAVRAASSPASPTYGDYPSLHALAAASGAPLRARRAVARVFQPLRQHGQGRRDASADDGHDLARDGTAHLRHVVGALPHAGRRRARRAAGIPAAAASRGLAGNVDIVAGLRRAKSSWRAASASAAAGGGSPVRTGTVAPSCLDTSAPERGRRPCAGLFPNQLLTAYGVAPLRASGLEGQGARVAIVGEAPTPIADVRAFRHCFGLGGTPLKIHGGRKHPADPRELARRDGRLDGGTAPAALRPLGPPARRERRRQCRPGLPRDARGAGPGGRFRPRAPGCDLGLLWRVRDRRRTVHGGAHGSSSASSRPPPRSASPWSSPPATRGASSCASDAPLVGAHRRREAAGARRGRPPRPTCSPSAART